MRSKVSMLTLVLALVGGAWAAAGCTSDNGDADGGARGSGGSGGGGSDADASADAIGDTGLVGCLADPAVTCPVPAVTYSNIQPIFQRRCVLCHDGTMRDQNGAAIWALTDYEHVSDWRDDIRADIANCLMPPVDAGVPLTVEERRALLEWVRCGASK